MAAVQQVTPPTAAAEPVTTGKGVSPRWRRVALVVAVAALIAALTALVFVVRAGDPGDGNWPANWDLRSSDNGVLFQVASDIFHSRPLDWGFSPQVYVFPEIPVSLLAYALAAGHAQLYFFCVAVINNTLLWLAFLAVAGSLFPSDSVHRRLARASLAMVPLLGLPLIGSSRMYSYHLAPTYYFGMNLMIVAAPVLYLGRSRWVRVAAAVALALTGASNPLLFVFTVPALAIVGALRARAVGWRAQRAPATWAAAVLLAAGAVRMLLFHRLEGGSPLAYIDLHEFARRLTALRYFVGNLFSIRTSGILTLLAVGVLLTALWGVRRRATRPLATEPATLTRAYFALMPVTGLLVTFVLLIANYLYFWPVLVAPLALTLLTVRPSVVRPLLVAGAAALVVTALGNGAVTNIPHASARYFTYRSDETRCLDSGLPPGDTVGYATFSDARRLSLTSTRPFRLIQLKDPVGPALWLTNRDYITSQVGRFFYFNDTGDETVLDSAFVEDTFGPPDGQFTCGIGQTVWLYDDPSKLATIARFYGVRAGS